MTEYHEGDLIRVTNKETGEGFQTRARKCPDETRYKGTLFLTNDWSKNWVSWTFLDWWTGMGSETHTLELIERATAALPTEPGLYRDNEGDYWTLKDDGKWYLDSEIDSTSTVRNYMPFTRLYTKEEVTKLIRKAAYAVDPDYEYDNRAAQFVMELEATL